MAITLVQRQPLDVGVHHFTHLDHTGQRRRLIRPRIDFPDANVFFTEKQALTLVIGHAAFRLGVDLEAAHQLAFGFAVRCTEPVLEKAAVLAIGEGIQLATGRLEQADAVNFRQWRGNFPRLMKCAAGAVDAEQAQAVAIAITRHRQIDILVAQHETGTHIDIVQTPDRQFL